MVGARGVRGLPSMNVVKVEKNMFEESEISRETHPMDKTMVTRYTRETRLNGTRRLGFGSILIGLLLGWILFSILQVVGGLISWAALTASLFTEVIL